MAASQTPVIANVDPADAAAAERRALSALGKGEGGRIVSIGGVDPDLEAKLREIGFAEGDDVEVLALGPLGGRPICVRLNETMIALRKEEARAITVARTR